MTFFLYIYKQSVGYTKHSSKYLWCNLTIWVQVSNWNVTCTSIPSPKKSIYHSPKQFICLIPWTWLNLQHKKNSKQCNIPPIEVCLLMIKFCVTIAHITTYVQTRHSFFPMLSLYINSCSNSTCMSRKKCASEVYCTNLNCFWSQSRQEFVPGVENR